MSDIPECECPKWPPNVPRDALCIDFTADNQKRGTYYVWKKLLRGDVQWFWSALGEDGVEDTAFEATQSARNWIRDGQATMPPRLKHQQTNLGD